MGCFKINKGTDFKKVLVNGKVFSASVVFEGTFFIPGTKNVGLIAIILKKLGMYCSSVVTLYIVGATERQP